MSKAEQLFDMVYKWGQAGVVADSNSMAFKTMLAAIIEEAKSETV